MGENGNNRDNRENVGMHWNIKVTSGIYRKM